MEILTLNNNHYSVIKLLGKGKGGYSYLVTDGGRQYVLKQIHHEPCSYYQFGNKIEAEIHDYKLIRDAGINIPEMLDIDIENERILKEYIDGPTAYSLVLEDKMKPEYIDQIRNMCSLLYPKGLNIDYFPTNFILSKNILWYIDYECNNYMEQWNFENWGIKYWSKTKEFCEYVKNNG